MSDHWAELRPVIVEAIMNQPRTLQKRIGPSEVGTPCDACLACKLADAPMAVEDVPWLSFLGSCVHAELQYIFSQDDRYLVEHEITVGQIGGVDITGHADLYDTHTASVIDWKVVGKGVLDSLRYKSVAKVKPQYHVQRNLYGIGFEAQGFPVNEVAVVFLPRNHPSIDALHIDTRAFDPSVGERALERANKIHDMLARLGLADTLGQLGGHIGTTYDCPRYEAAA